MLFKQEMTFHSSCDANHLRPGHKINTPIKEEKNCTKNGNGK
uniref:Uncharacterized protein n=1 Tax=Rhizophora mucronata TaxID=61149 RepID=A0A2P2PST1_RHIMU